MKQFSVFFISVLFLLYCKNSSGQDLQLAKSIDTNHHSVVAILMVDSTGKKVIGGSGVFIHPQVILTAGHVTYNTVKWLMGNSASEIGYISFGNNAFESNDRKQFDWTKNVETHPDQTEFIKSLSDTTGNTSFTMFTDIGLIFLDQPIFNKTPIHLPDSFSLKRVSKNDHLVGAGYGYAKTIQWNRENIQKTQQLVDGFRRLWRPAQISLINELWIKTDCDSISNRPFTGMFDSGSPFLLNDTVVVGIWGTMDTAPAPCAYSSLAARIDNPKILRWINDCITSRLY